MALDNFISVVFEPSELTQIDDAILTIKNIVFGKLINLTPLERKQHGRVGDETEDWILKVKEYMGTNPDLILSHIDVTEFNNDFNSRRDILPRLRAMEQILSMFDDTNLLLGTDLYHNAITFYKGLKAAAMTDAPGAKVIYDDLKTRFPGRPPKVDPPA